MIKESIFQEIVAIPSMFAAQNRIVRDMRRKVIKLQREINKCMMIIGGLNTFSVIEISNSQKVSNNVIELYSSLIYEM